jgi:hypothetical protein
VAFEIYEAATWAGVVQDAEVNAGKEQQMMSSVM